MNFFITLSMRVPVDPGGDSLVDLQDLFDNVMTKFIFIRTDAQKTDINKSFFFCLSTILHFCARFLF